jgi:hypothetical protein
MGIMYEIIIKIWIKFKGKFWFIINTKIVSKININWYIIKIRSPWKKYKWALSW